MNFTYFSHFGDFLLLCDLVSIIFTKIFMGSEVCLERCDSYGNFGFKKKSNNFILREFCKRTHCPPIVTLALLLFLCKNDEKRCNNRPLVAGAVLQTPLLFIH